MKTVVSLCALALIALSSAVSAAPQRDEAKASHFLYCAGLNSYWVYALKDKQPDSKEIAMRQSASDNFWEATFLLSDEEFARAHKNEAAKQVRSVVASADQDNGVRLKSEDLSCANTLHDEVVPLLKAENLVGDTFDTTVSVRHVAEVTRDVAEWHGMKHPECKFQKVTSAKIIKRDKDSVTEHWTVQACDGKQFTYHVLVIPQDGGITDSVGDVEASSDEAHKP